MDQVRAQAVRYLALDQLAADPALARRLPPDLARRFHALALAEDRGRITVAMADPGNRQAREAIAAALGSEACAVQGDSVTIDALLAQIWGSETERPLRLVLSASAGAPVTCEAKAFARSLAGLLEARLCRLDAIPGPDLVLIDQPGEADEGAGPVFQGRESDDRNLRAHARLVVRQPRWPLTSILLVLGGTDRDGEAIDWAQRLGIASRCRLTLLAVAPPVPIRHNGHAQDALDLPSLLTAKSALGQRMQLVAYRLTAWGIDCTVRLRQGVPAIQICREARTGDFDLVVLGDHHSCYWRSWPEADRVGDVLDQLDRPVLLTVPDPA